MPKPGQTDGHLDVRGIGIKSIQQAHQFATRYGDRLSERLRKSIIAAFDGHEEFPQLLQRLQGKRLS